MPSSPFAVLLLIGSLTVVMTPAHLSAQGVLVVADSAVVAERQPSTDAHTARFTVTNRETTTDTFYVGCVGLGQARCSGTSVSQVTLDAEASVVVEASYTVKENGRGLVRVMVFSPSTRRRASGATLIPVSR